MANSEFSFSEANHDHEDIDDDQKDVNDDQ